MLQTMRKNTLRQYHVLGSANCCIRLIHPTTTPTSVGSSTAKRNGLLRTKLEQSSSQPIVGSAQSALIGISTISLIHSASRCVGRQISVSAPALCSSA